MGYVGLSLACLLAQKNEVCAVDIIEEKVEQINKRSILFADSEIERFLSTKTLQLKATLDASKEIELADYIIIATPTDYDDDTHFFNTSTVESVLDTIKQSGTSGTIVIKSTVPVGYTDQLSRRHPNLDIVFSPEFLREGNALYDNIYPSRIIVGVPRNRDDLETKARCFANLLAEGALADNPQETRLVSDLTQQIIGASEAEAVKLFSNTYLALRVAFFNELDTFSELRELNTAEIIKGIGMDPRIGDFYNNPSFGYGGYCLPKDSQQLLANYSDIPQNIIEAVVVANNTRKDFIANQILSRRPKSVGVYRLIMKSDSDNFRQSSVMGVMARLYEQGITCLVYEPLLDPTHEYEFETVSDINEFKNGCDLIICNRWSDELSEVTDKVYTRDLWNTN